MRKGLPFLLLVAGCQSISATAVGQMIPSSDASALLSSPRLSPEARKAIQDRVDAVHAEFRATHGGLGPEQFGVQCCQITQIHSSAFYPPYGSGGWNDASYGYMNLLGEAQSARAPVQFPTGVELKYLDLYFFDDSGQDITAVLRAYTGGGFSSGGPSEAVLATVTSSGSNGYGYAVSPPFSYTVNNNVAFDPDAAQLEVSVSLPSHSHAFKAVDLWWMRQVSPPPDTATFNDVPTGHPYFQFVEALAAAGITGGCGVSPPLYCVDAPITRGQMAVFLSKALGLHWPF